MSREKPWVALEGGLGEEEEEMEEGEGRAATGVGTLQTGSFILHVPEWVSQLLKVF